MGSNTVLELADDLATQLTAESWSETVTVERTWNPSKSLTDFTRGTPPLFSVIPSFHKRTRIDSTSFASFIQIDVGIRCRSDDEDRSNVLSELVESVQTFCEKYTPANRWPLVNVDLDPLFDSATLNTATVWFSVIRLQYGVSPKDSD